MKTILLALFFFVQLGVKSQNDVMPLSQDGVWLRGYGLWDWFTGSFVEQPPYGMKITDTLSINDTTYFQFSSFDYCNGGEVFTPSYLIREDSGKYYFREDEFDSERLFFDFTLNVGDAVSFFDCWGNQTYSLQVTSIDYITLEDGSERRQWTLHYDGSIIYPDEKWIEGIGNATQGFRYPIAEVCLDLGRWNRCYIENDVWLYSAYTLDLNTDCCNIISVEESHLLNAILIYPNPTHDEIKYSGMIQFESVEIINSLGEVVLSDNSNRKGTSGVLDVSNLPSGIYLINFKGPKFIESQRVLIEH